MSRGLRPLRGLRTPVNHGHEPPALRGMICDTYFKSKRDNAQLPCLRHDFAFETESEQSVIFFNVKKYIVYGPCKTFFIIFVVNYH